MKVILVNGSPHKNGCTYRALREADGILRGKGFETEICWIGNQAIHPCIGCRKCAQLGKCVFDDVVNEFREKARGADGYIFGSPVHFSAISSGMKCFMDRVFYVDIRSGGDTFRLKPAACVLSARRAGTTAAFDEMVRYFTLMEMPVASSCYWNMVHGAQPEQVEQDQEGLQVVRIMARNLAYMLECREAGRKAGVALPEREPPVRTNFVR